MTLSRTSPEPWLRGTLADVPAVQRAVLHALELASEDLDRWCGELTDDELTRRVGAIPSIAFQLRHVARSIDRLLTYAEGRQLSPEQLTALKSEAESGATRGSLFQELDRALEIAATRIRAFSPAEMEQIRVVGKKELPTTLGGLLIHIADHTQRHVGQAITTAKLVSSEAHLPR
jgi:uncharacterized damage-inducible protein DinB